MFGSVFMNDTLGQLARVIEQRKNASAEGSYVASLCGKGPDAILKKIGEESTELIIAAKNADAGLSAISRSRVGSVIAHSVGTLAAGASARARLSR